jgi:hypothetical protein
MTWRVELRGLGEGMINGREGLRKLQHLLFSVVLDSDHTRYPFQLERA